MPELLNKRHEATVEHYRTQFQTLLDHLEGIATADSTETLGTQIDKALNLLQSQNRPRQPSFNPEQLPFSLSKAEVRAPFLSQAEFQDHYQIESKSAPTTTRSKRRRAPPSDIYLAETEEVQFTDDIVALSETLEHHPVKIYLWVRDNIKFMPTYGATQSVQQTLDMKQGNAFDIASLLIALLRSSGIHARYVYGSIQISAPRISNWLQVSDAQAATTLLSRSAIPNTPLVSGGAIKEIRLEHIWVDAWIDFRPSRGARHRKGDSWIPLDASFKQHTFEKGLNLLEAVPFDIDGLRDYLINTTYTNEYGGVMGISQTYLKTLLSDYQAELQSYIEANQLEPEAVLDRYSIITENRKQLAAGLPYRLISKLDTFAQLSARYQNAFTLKFYHSAQAQNLDDPAVSINITLPALGSQRLSVIAFPDCMKYKKNLKRATPKGLNVNRLSS